MAKKTKRFVDAGKFKDPWYRKLNPVQKCLWEFLINECDHAGILEVDLDSMSFHIGAEISNENLKSFGERIVFIKPDLIFIPKFIAFQYGKLNPENKVHKSVLVILEEYKLKPLTSPLLGAKDKDKEKDKEKEKETGGILRGDFSEPQAKELDIYASPEIEQAFKTYENNCPNLLKLTFERNNKEIRELISRVLKEINFDFAVFTEVCKSANALKVIVNNKIGLKIMLNNYINILNGTFTNEANKLDESKLNF